MKVLSEMNIDSIHGMTETAAAEHAIEKAEIKGYTVYFVDFGGYFGYSALVYGNGHHIYYADDFQLHHSSKTQEELRAYYEEALNGKLFTKEELSTVKSYDDYRAKQEFLMSYYGMTQDSISDWFVGPDEERERLLEQTKTMFHSSVCFAWFHSRDFVNEVDELWDTLQKAREALETSFEYNKSKFLYEMYNHEYGINWQGDYDVVSCFANVNHVRDYENRESLFAAAGFTDLQKRAYMAARKEYFERYWGND